MLKYFGSKPRVELGSDEPQSSILAVKLQRPFLSELFQILYIIYDKIST